MLLFFIDLINIEKFRISFSFFYSFSYILRSRATSQVALRGVYNTNMGKDSRVRDHELKMAKYLNEAQIQQAQIDDETKIDMVLESLPDAFNEFKVNYNLNMMKLTMVELMNGLIQLKRFKLD